MGVLLPPLKPSLLPLISTRYTYCHEIDLVIMNLNLNTYTFPLSFTTSLLASYYPLEVPLLS